MRTITLEAATPESGRALYSALSPFYPEFDVDGEGKCFVSVSFGSQKEMLEVLGAIHLHLAGPGDRIESWVATAEPPNPLPQSRGNGGST
jgi:hypothetical protein